MKFLPMLFLFYLTATQAEIIDQSYLVDSILTVSQINKGTILNLPRPECNESVKAPKKNNKELFNRCAIDLCGPPEKNVSQYITDDQFYRSANWWTKLRINLKDSLFNKIYDISINKKLEELEDLKKYITDPSFENISVEGQIQLTSEILSPYVVITANPNEKKLEDRISVTTIYPKDADDELKDAIKNYAIKLKQSVTTSPQKFNSLGIYTDEELASIIKKMIKKVKESYEGNPESLKDRPKFANDLKMFEKMYETKDPFRAMMDINLRGITNISNYIAQTTKKDSLEQVSCDVKSCKSLFKKYFEKSINKEQVEKNIALYEKFLKNPNAKKNAINRCKSNIIFKETKRSDERKAREVFLVARKNVINNLLPRFSEHSRGILTDYLNTQLAVNTLKRDDTESLDTFSMGAKEYIENNKEKKSSDDFDRIWSLTRLNDSFDDIDPLEDVYACNQATSTAWDNFVGMSLVKKHGTPEQKKFFDQFGIVDQIFASDFTCQNAEHGHHIAAHEISHSINNLILNIELSESSSALYNKARACVSSQYSKMDAPVKEHAIVHKGDTSFSEEDTADFLATLSTPHDKKIYICALLKKSPLNNSYSNLEFIKQGSNHSSPFSRVIFEAINRDIPLPTTCKKLIEQERPAMRFEKCEL